jgi:hypothetical protein
MWQISGKSVRNREEVKKRLSLGIAYYNSVQNIFIPVSSLKITLQNVILPVVLYGCETWYLTLKEEIDEESL